MIQAILFAIVNSYPDAYPQLCALLSAAGRRLSAGTPDRHPVALPPVLDCALWVAVALGYGLALLLLWQCLVWGL